MVVIVSPLGHREWYEPLVLTRSNSVRVQHEVQLWQHGGQEPRQRCRRPEGVSRLDVIDPFFSYCETNQDRGNSALKNPNVSDEAKESAKERLNQI